MQVAAGLGITHDTMHVPLLVAASYASTQGPSFRPKLIALLRHPVARIQSAYWQ